MSLKFNLDLNGIKENKNIYIIVPVIKINYLMKF